MFVYSQTYYTTFIYLKQINAGEQQLSSLHHRVESQWLFSWGSLIARPVNSKIILMTQSIFNTKL